MKKIIILGIVFLFVGMGFQPAFAVETKSTTDTVKNVDILSLIPQGRKIIYVDDDNTEGPWDGTQQHPYQFIQDGVNASSVRDTVYVYSGNYYENIVVDKSIKLIGENKETTCIDCNNDCIIISSNRVTVSGFNIQSSGKWSCGILVRRDDNIIRGNTFTNIYNGVFIFDGVIIQRRNIITENIFNNIRGTAIGADNTYNTYISKNTISNCRAWGIGLFGGYFNNVFLNSIKDADEGIMIMSSGFNKIYTNNIENCSEYGIKLEFPYEIEYYNDLQIFNKIVNNNIVNNKQGIDLQLATFTTIKDNNFIGNQEDGNAYFWQCIGTRWKGNYWDDWDGTGWYKIKGKFSMIFLREPYFRDFVVYNYDKSPASEPYDITTTQGCDII